MRHEIQGALALAVFASGCATPFLSLESLVEKAKRNEVAAANSARDRFVLVGGTVLDIAYHDGTQLVTSGTSGRVGFVGVSRSTTRQQRVRQPYVALRVSDGTVVFCFLDSARLDDADRIEKGKAAMLSGGLYSFSRDDSGSLQVTLSGCRLED